MNTVTGQHERSLEDIGNFHRAVDMIAKDKNQREAIFRAAGFAVDAEGPEEVTGLSAGS